MPEIPQLRGDATAPFGQGADVTAHAVLRECAPKERGGPRDRPPAVRRRPLSAGRTARGSGFARRSGAPGVGCGPAGGDRSRTEPLTRERLDRRGTAVTVHEHGEGRG